MAIRTNYDVIIIGGSYAGLSAAMALGRSRRDVLIIDSGKPCNRQTPHAHNFITHDGKKPADIAREAKEQVLKYDTVHFLEDLAVTGARVDGHYEITTQTGAAFRAPKLLFATGVADEMPAIEGFAECWGISVLHCPYCHGYEVNDKKLGMLGNGDMGFEFAVMLLNWSKDLTVFTNGASTLTEEQTHRLKEHNVQIIETELSGIRHEDGYMSHLQLSDDAEYPVDALFARVPFHQHCDIPRQLGCELNEMGHIKVDAGQRTTLYDVFAAGDSTVMFRSLPIAIAAGTMAGAMINKDLIGERF